MLHRINDKSPDLFDSRANIPSVSIPEGRSSAVAEQHPEDAKWHDLSLDGLREMTRTPSGDIIKANRKLFKNSFPEIRHERKGWKQEEITNLLQDPSARGNRFRETISSVAATEVRNAVRGLIHDSSKALPLPHDLFDSLLLQGAIRIPSDELIPLEDLKNCRDAKTIIAAAKKIWLYSGFEGIAGDHAYSDIENPPDSTLSKYHGNRSRQGINLQSRVAWSDVYRSALVTRAPIAMSNMEANSDLESSRLARQAGVLPALFSSPPEQRREAARMFGNDGFITVRTSSSELALAKELLDLGANVHIELANAFNHLGIEAVMRLKSYIRKQNYDKPRFVTLGKGVSGAYFLAALLAGADGVFVNRGSSMICSTPTVTGSGIRTCSAVYEAALAQRLGLILTGRDVPVWGDAGISCGADILKLMFAGAEGGMVGTTFIRTVDSPPRKDKVLLQNGSYEYRTESWGDASRKAQLRRLDESTNNSERKEVQVAPQGVETTHSIPLRADGEPVTIDDVATRLRLEIQGGVGDACAESVSEIPRTRRGLTTRFPEEGALLELKAKQKLALAGGEVVETRASRIG